MPNKDRIKKERSEDLLKQLHILTVDGKLNQDSNRKLKQIYHLCNFLEPIIKQLTTKYNTITIVDQGCGKAYLGFILYDLYLKQLQDIDYHIYGIDNRKDLIDNARSLANKMGFSAMEFYHESVGGSAGLPQIPKQIDIVTALHACDTATDDAIQFGLEKKAKHIVLVPCCHAQISQILTKNKHKALENNLLSEIRRHPLHTRTFASHLTNVMRCLWLEAHGYTTTVTELVGREHSLKNELIIASQNNKPNNRSLKRLKHIIQEYKLQERADSFLTIER